MPVLPANCIRTRPGTVMSRRRDARIAGRMCRTRCKGGECYDRIELPEIRPDVTRVTVRGGVCPCCARRFKATPPSGLEPGSPFGPNLRSFVLYLRYTQAISYERLARLMSDLLGLRISEGALANMLDASRSAAATMLCWVFGT